jgi:hypothetical protein
VDGCGRVLLSPKEIADDKCRYCQSRRKPSTTAFNSTYRTTMRIKTKKTKAKTETEPAKPAQPEPQTPRPEFAVTAIRVLPSQVVKDHEPIRAYPIDVTAPTWSALKSHRSD